LLTFTNVVSATAVYVGSQLDLGQGWRNPSTAKTWDLDGDGIYGTAGYEMFAVHPNGNDSGNGQGPPANHAIQSLPSWVSVTLHTTLSYTGDYSLIDDPNNVGGNPLWSGITYYNLGNIGQTYNILDLTFPGGVSFVRLGIFIGDYAPGVQPDQLQVQGTGGDSGRQTVAQNTGSTVHNDWYFFDLTNIAAGQSVSIFARSRTTNSGGGAVGISGITFDTPEPSTAV
jgi:hypothetical protein